MSPRSGSAPTRAHLAGALALVAMFAPPTDGAVDPEVLREIVSRREIVRSPGRARAAEEIARHLEGDLDDGFVVLAECVAMQPVHGPDPPASARIETLLDGLEACDRSRVRAAARARLDQVESSASREAAIRALGRVGDAEALDAVLSRTAELELEGSEVQAVGDCVARLLRAHPTLAGRVASTAIRAGGPRGEALLDALLACASSESLDALAVCLDEMHERQAQLLGGMADVATQLEPPFPATVLRDVEWLLDDRSEDVRAAAATCIAALHDHEATGRLVELLDDGSAVRAAALGALQSLSGLGFRDDPRRWQSWLNGELAWWRDRSDEVFVALESDAPAEVLTALGELSTHRHRREELASHVHPLLDHTNPGIAGAAERALAGLGLDPTNDSGAAPRLRPITPNAR